MVATSFKRTCQMRLRKVVNLKLSSILLCLLLVILVHVWYNCHQPFATHCPETLSQNQAEAHRPKVRPAEFSETTSLRPEPPPKFHSGIDVMYTIHKHNFRDNIPLSDDWLAGKSAYFKLRSEVVNPLMTNYIIEPQRSCEPSRGGGGESPYLLMMIPSLAEHITMRKTIRSTWGSVVNVPWPGTSHAPPVKIVFVFGRSTAKEEASILESENNAHGDILYVDFVDSYQNLTYKSLTSLYWASSRCPGAKFFMKVDEDTFINVPYLLDFLQYHERGLRRAVIGNANLKPVSVRHGKWAVNFDSYPLPNYPHYMYGHSYVITSDVTADIAQASTHMPYIPVEDATVTGVLAYALNVTRLHNRLFAKLDNVHTCAIVKNTVISITSMSYLNHQRLWSAVQRQECSYKIIYKLKSKRKPKLRIIHKKH